MIIIRKRNAPKINLSLFKGCKHFEIIGFINNKKGAKNILPYYNANNGAVELVVNQLEEENVPFILFTSIVEFNKTTRFSFHLDKIGYVMFENGAGSNVPTKDLKSIASLFKEFCENNPKNSVVTNWYIYLGRLASDHIIDDPFQAVLILPDGKTKTKSNKLGKSSRCGRLWISNKKLFYLIEQNKKVVSKEAFPVFTSNNSNKNIYERLSIDIVDYEGHVITDTVLLSIGNNFKRYVRTCHDSMSMDKILSEFKRTYLKGMDIDIKFQYLSENSGEFIIDDFPTDLVNDKSKNRRVVIPDKYYTSAKDLIEDYFTGKIIIIEHLDAFTRKEISDLMRDYPLLFAELIQYGCSMLTEKQIEDLKNINEFFNNNDDDDDKNNQDDYDDDDDDDDYDYQMIKKDQYYDETLGQVITMVVCASCREEDIESSMDEWEVEGKTIYLCNDCIESSQVTTLNSKSQKRGAGF